MQTPPLSVHCHTDKSTQKSHSPTTEAQGIVTGTQPMYDVVMHMKTPAAGKVIQQLETSKKKMC